MVQRGTEKKAEDSIGKVKYLVLRRDEEQEETNKMRRTFGEQRRGREQIEQEDKETKNGTLPKALRTQALTALTKSTIPKITQPLLKPYLFHITHPMHGHKNSTGNH